MQSTSSSREVSPNTDPESLGAYAEIVAMEHGLDVKRFIFTLNCEGHWDRYAVGDRGLAIGVAQIRKDYWPSITKAQAEDPYWSIQWMAEEWSAGHADYWTCAREYGSSSP